MKCEAFLKKLSRKTICRTSTVNTLGVIPEARLCSMKCLSYISVQSLRRSRCNPFLKVIGSPIDNQSSFVSVVFSNLFHLIILFSVVCTNDRMLTLGNLQLIKKYITQYIYYCTLKTLRQVNDFLPVFKKANPQIS